jgi:hypothetical protein
VNDDLDEAPKPTDDNPFTTPLLRYFEYEHLPEGVLRETSAMVSVLAYRMEQHLPVGPELTTGLRKLLEAKDCFVRAALDLPTPSEED